MDDSQRRPGAWCHFGIWLASLFLLPVVPVPAFAEGIEMSKTHGVLRVEVSGIEAAEGSIVVAIWDSRERWLKEDPLWGEALAAKEGELIFFLRNVAPGHYALSVFHDLNDNQDLDTNFLGIPTEPIGFSNNVRNRFGPARFEQAAFLVETEPVTQAIKLRRLQQRQSPEAEPIEVEEASPAADGVE